MENVDDKVTVEEYNEKHADEIVHHVWHQGGVILSIREGMTVKDDDEEILSENEVITLGTVEKWFK